MALTRLSMIWAVAGLALRCAPPPAPHVPSIGLESTRGGVEEFPTNLSRASLTVLVFFSADCPCFSAHERRLDTLVQDYSPKGVRFLLVDSEGDASLKRDALLVREQGPDIPVLIDPNAVLAAALDAEYATYSVIVDRKGAIRYRGGIDSDRSHLRADATFYLRDALDDLLGGRAPRRAEAKTLGCVLQTR